jgi:thiamine biosynthesis lipoprotein
MISRARPLLGTVVSIRAQAREEAFQRAFAAIEKVHALMSARCPQSDLSRINREAHRRAVSVHPWTLRVLRSAAAISKASQGAFDVTLGRIGASCDDILLLPGGRVRLRRRALLDLGGIAKGFAVDLAVAVLRRCGASGGSVNAGGDLRVFGPAEQTVRVRLPGDCSLAAPLLALRQAACATSGGYFGSRQIDARQRRTLCSDYSVTVRAPTCMVADALTKAVAALGPQRPLLRRFDAQAYLVDAAGTVYAPAR